MLLSESGYNYAIVFINQDMILEHSIFYKNIPSVAEVREAFEEMSYDECFKNIIFGELLVQIFSIKNYIEVVGDIDLEEN